MKDNNSTNNDNPITSIPNKNSDDSIGFRLLMDAALACGIFSDLQDYAKKLAPKQAQQTGNFFSEKTNHLFSSKVRLIGRLSRTGLLGIAFFLHVRHFSHESSATMNTIRTTLKLKAKQYEQDVNEERNQLILGHSPF